MIDNTPIVWSRQVILIVHPAEMQNWMTFIAPLKLQSWVVVGMTIVVCGIALTISGHIFEGDCK